MSFIQRLKEWLNGSTKGFSSFFKSSVKRQKDAIKLVTRTNCPKCKSKLRLIGYENSYDLRHYEVAVYCDECKGRFVFTETGVKGEYIVQ